MSKLLLTLVMLLSGCGLLESARKDCTGSDLEMACNSLLGQNDSDNDKRIDNLEQRVNQLETDFEYQEMYIYALISQYVVLSDKLESLEINIAELTETEEQARFQLISQIDSLSARMRNVQTGMAAIQAALTVLEAEDSVVGYTVPCGINPSYYNEILMRTRSGKLYAYFESGSSRFLTLLKPNSWYSTTDSKHCVFFVDANMKVNPGVEY